MRFSINLSFQVVSLVYERFTRKPWIVILNPWIVIDKPRIMTYYPRFMFKPWFQLYKPWFPELLFTWLAIIGLRRSGINKNPITILDSYDFFIVNFLVDMHNGTSYPFYIEAASASARW